MLSQMSNMSRLMWLIVCELGVDLRYLMNCLIYVFVIVGSFHPSQATKALRESRGIALLYF